MNMIKNTLKTLMLATILLIIAISASADMTAPTQVNIGGGAQERGIFASTAFTITNTDLTNQITDITATFTFSLAGYTAQDFNTTITGMPSSLNPNATSTVTIQSFVPLSFESGARQIGTLTITAVVNDTQTTKAIPVYMEAASKIEIDQVDIEVDGDSERVSDGETIDNVKRGSTISLELTVQNLFSTSQDIDLNDITITVFNNALDIDEEVDMGDLAARDDDTATIDFNIPQDADDGRETIKITVEATDDNNAFHTAIFDFELDVEVERYDVQINSISTASSVCIGSSANLQINLENTGLRDLDDAMVYIVSDDLAFNKKITDIVVDEGDLKTVSTTISIPTGTPQGTYLVEVESYYEPATAALRDSEVLNLVVRNCQATTTPPTNGSTTTPPTTGSGFEIFNPQSGAVFGQPVEKSKSIFGSDNTMILVLVATNLLILVVLVYIIASNKRYY